MTTNPAYLVLADGTVWQGTPFGAPLAAAEKPATGQLWGAVGEAVFTTGMTGYQETLTDPSFAGQIVCQTFPAVGNAGLNAFDGESRRAWPVGYVVRTWCEAPSNFRCEETLDAFLRHHGIPGLCGVDTRALTRHLRRHGTLPAALVAQPPQDLAAFTAGLRLAKPLAGRVYEVSCTAPEVWPAEGGARHRVVLYDYGAKNAIRRRLATRGCEVVSVPCDTPVDEALSHAPDGFVLSNGPGDPAAYPELTAIVQELTGTGLPIFGICLGHQLLARSFGAKTQKLPFGHRGANQPVVDLATRRTFVTSQNHGYTVVAESLAAGEVSHVNANDGSVEGIAYPGHNAFSVQFHPEACAGPTDTERLFDRFVAML